MLVHPETYQYYTQCIIKLTARFQLIVQRRVRIKAGSKTPTQ